VLDLGAGTGVAGRAALAAGARLVVSVDFAAGMLRGCAAGLHPVAADAGALPFRDGCFGLVLAAARRISLRRAAQTAVTGTGPLVVDMLVLTAR
jgi:ubiquinone/menaquinone biosynthesis C-methylase UbiE